MGIKYDIDLQMNVQDARASIATLKGEIANLKKLVSSEEIKLGNVDANTTFNNLRKGFDTAFKAIQKEAAVASSQIEKNIQIKNLDRIMQQFAAAKSTSIDKYGEYAGERFYQKRIDAANKLKDALSGAEVAAKRLADAEAKATAQAHSRVQDKAAANIMTGNASFLGYKESSANSTQKLLADNAAYDKKLRAQRERSNDIVAANIMQSDLNLHIRKVKQIEAEKVLRLSAIEKERVAAEKAAYAANKAKSQGDGGMWANFTNRLGIAADFSIAYKVLQGIYAAFQSVKNAAGEIISSFDELAGTQAKLAMWASIITKGTMSYAEAFVRAGVNMRAFNQAAVGALSSTKDLSTAIDEFAQQGLIFGPDMQQQMVRFADFVLMVAQTTGNSARQVRQEVQAIFSGNIRPENQVLRTMKNFGMLSADDIKGLKSGAVNPELIRGIIEKISTQMGPVYDAMFGSSVEASMNRFKNTFTAKYVEAFIDANAELSSKNLFADAMNDAYKMWLGDSSIDAQMEMRKKMIQDIASILRASMPIILNTISAIEKVISTVGGVIAKMVYYMEIVRLMSEKSTGINDENRKKNLNPLTIEGQANIIWESIKKAFSGASKQPNPEGSLQEQAYRNTYGYKHYPDAMREKDNTTQSGLTVLDTRKAATKPNKAYDAALQRLKDFEERIDRMGEATEAPLDKAGSNLRKLWDELEKFNENKLNLPKEAMQRIGNKLGDLAPKLYMEEMRTMSEELSKAVEDGTGVSVKQAQKYAQLLKDMEVNLHKFKADGLILDSKSGPIFDKTNELKGKLDTANKAREDAAMFDLYKYSNPAADEYNQREKSANEFFEKKAKQVLDEQKIAEILAEQQRVISRMQVNRAGGWGAVVNGAQEGIAEYGAKINNTFQNVKESAARAMQSVEDSIIDAFEKGKWGASQFFTMIQHEFIKLAVQKTITGPMASILGNVFKAFGKHGGGEMGTTHGGTRSISPLAFANAPRFHNGLRSDEFPAILQTGENVTRRGGELPMQTIVIENHTGQQVQKQEKQGNNGSRELRFVIGDAMKQIISGGQMDSTFKQTFGLRRVGA